MLSIDGGDSIRKDRASKSDRLDESELRQRGYTIIEPFLLDNFSILELKDRCPGKVHLAPSGSRQFAQPSGGQRSVSCG